MPDTADGLAVVVIIGLPAIQASSITMVNDSV